MRAVVQRVSRAEVRVDGQVVGAVGAGLCVLVGAQRGDEERDAVALALKVASLRVFTDESGKMNRCVTEVGGGVLAVSQFTLLADVSRGNRPSFVEALAPERARELVSTFCGALRSRGIAVEEGRFGASMQVSLVNDGPVTILLDTRAPALGAPP